MKNTKKYYIIYEVQKNENGDILDILNRYDNDNLKSIAEWLGIDYTNINKYINKDIDNIKTRLKDNKYFIFKDYE